MQLVKLQKIMPLGAARPELPALIANGLRKKLAARSVATNFFAIRRLFGRAISGLTAVAAAASQVFNFYRRALPVDSSMSNSIESYIFA